MAARTGSLDDLSLVESHYVEALRAEAVVPAVEVHCDEDVTWVVHPGSTWRNAGILVRLSQQSASRRLNQLVKRYERHGRGMGLWVSPLATPGNLAALLSDRGLRCKKQFPAMIRRLGESGGNSRIENDIAIHRVLDVEPFRRIPHPGIGRATTAIRRHELTRLAALVSSDDPRTRAYVAWVEGTPVGAIELFLGEDAAGVHALQVMPDWEGRGVASALLEHVCGEAARCGYRTIVLLASSEGQPLYARRGFTEVGRIAYWYRSFQRTR